MEALILFSILIVTIIVSIPIGITLGLSTCIAMMLTSDIPMLMIAQKAVTGLDSFPLLAIPFFILAGALMCTG
ncbi:MAG TPA: TRAP transporter large permease subunit, partial [Spirochaetota bacterium]|nr:TRAP transporter large permease subunit [Spirochaetota bacterium]